jgi:hypothetical protein
MKGCGWCLQGALPSDHVKEIFPGRSPLRGELRRDGTCAHAAREPETQDASRVEPWDIDLFVDLTTILFGRPGDDTPNVRAQNINTIDEVPDSNWFTNRTGARGLSIDGAVRGPVEGDGPAAGTWTIVRPKESGVAPGFTMRDEKGTTWFVSLRLATLGFAVPSWALVRYDEQPAIGDSRERPSIPTRGSHACARPPSCARGPMTTSGRPVA